LYCFCIFAAFDNRKAVYEITKPDNWAEIKPDANTRAINGQATGDPDQQTEKQ